MRLNPNNPMHKTLMMQRAADEKRKSKAFHETVDKYLAEGIRKIEFVDTGICQCCKKRFRVGELMVGRTALSCKQCFCESFASGFLIRRKECDIQIPNDGRQYEVKEVCPSCKESSFSVPADGRKYTITREPIVGPADNYDVGISMSTVFRH